MERTWTVVQFIDEETVEAVPTTWIINNKCYWPPFQMEKIIAAIKKHAEPNTCWPSYDITIFRNSSYDNYQTAREKAKKAEFTSELTSDTDNNKISKRKVIRKKFSSSSDSLAEDTVLRTPPVMQESSQSTSRVLESNKSRLKSTNLLSSENTDKQTKHLSHKFLDNNYTSRDYEPNVQSNETDIDNNNDDLRAMKNELLQQNHQQPNANQRNSIFSSFDLPFNSVKDIEQL
ncbi:PREDICTED: uncharacterized protein LOC108776242, partial [Cyphomyrmex costatus]|uniref:uncharacterized protein LOC108776242 n=1 Tax=Cyphomyrmex costatus TaxID=456900 RepID=UPI0008522EB6